MQNQPGKTKRRRRNKNKMQDVKQKKLEGQLPKNEEHQSQQSSSSSEQDQDAVLLTDKVQQKLLSFVAKLKTKDKSLYNMQKPIFDDEDFQKNQQQMTKKQNQQKYTYKDLIMQDYKKVKKNGNIDIEQLQDESSQSQLAPALQEKKAKQSFKNAFKKQSQNQQTNQNDLFKVKKIQPALKQNHVKSQDEKFKQYVHSLPKDNKQSAQDMKVIEQFWGNNQNLDQTDLFLKRYILDKKWLSKKLNKANKEEQMIDQQDQRRSQQMDRFQAQYNFRFQQPDGNKLQHFPRHIQQSVRIKPQTRRQKRKALEFRKAEEQKELRQQAQKKKQELKSKILEKITQDQNQQQGFSHDWFFCDDCCKGLMQKEVHYVCSQCEDYILCEQCYELIIHPHQMTKAKVPKGFGAPNTEISEKILSKLKNCNKCRKKLLQQAVHFQYTDRNYITLALCEKCYDQSDLSIKKKYKKIQPQTLQSREAVQKMLQQDPQKIKQLTNHEQIEEMVDEYLKNDFEDVLSGGLKTKFKYINVKPQSFGLSDEQILYGDDKQLNKYVSIKKLAPYMENNLKLRNSVFNKKIKQISKSVKQNKKQILKPRGRGRNLMQKMKETALLMKLKRRKLNAEKKRVKLTDLSDPNKQEQYKLGQNRLASYGLSL